MADPAPTNQDAQSSPFNPANPLAWVVSLFTTARDNVIWNVNSSFGGYTPKDWIRLIIIVCTYLLLRPHILKYGENRSKAAMEAAQREGTDAEVHPNDLREGGAVKARDEGGAKRSFGVVQGGPLARPMGTKVSIPGVADSSDEEEEGVKKGDVKWGKKARVRQRKFVRKTVEQTRAQGGADSDKEIEDLLED